jgi:ABC-2 type transport system ATP-binding protein
MIRTQGLTKVFKIGKKLKEDFTAVDGLDLHVPRGQVFGFLGPNGAGKTTTVRMLTSLIHPTAGQAQVNGLTLGLDDNAIRRSVGILTESPGLYERLSAEKNLRIYADLYQVPDPQAAVTKYLSMLGLWERRADPAGAFSKGMRQKLAVARALLHEPPLLFLDEPTIGLDARNKIAVREFIRGQNRRHGTTVILTTHDMQDIEALTQRILLIGNGRLLLDGQIDELKRRVSPLRRITIEHRGPLAELPAGVSIEDQRPGQTKLQVDTSRVSVSEAISQLAKKLEIEDLTVAGPTAEELVLSLYKEYTL